MTAGIGVGLGIFFIVVVLVLIVLAILTTIFWIWMLIDCLTNNYVNPDNKLLWVILIFFTHIVGALVYFFAVRLPQRAQSIPGMRM